MHQPLRVVFLCLTLMFSISLASHAQSKPTEEKEPWSFGANGYYGSYFGYRSGLSKMNYPGLHEIEVYANRHTLGKRYWERKYKLPYIGFALSYINYMVPDELGKAYTATSYLDAPITKLGKGNLRYTLGIGFAYSTRHYTSGTNEENKAIGSAVTFALRGNMRYEHPLSDKLFLNLHVAFRHFSNGSLNQSNNGMNMPFVGVGVRYQPKQVQYPTLQDTTAPELNKNIRLNVRLGAGVKEVLRDDFKHPVYMASIYASKRLTYTNSVLIGLDAFHDTAIGEEYLSKGFNIPDGYLDKRLAGMYIGHELHLSNLSFMFNYGYYLYQPHKLYPSTYQRYGLKYMVRKNLSANALLLAHSGRANVIEWGLGFHL